jgi:HEAT repeat protein
MKHILRLLALLSVFVFVPIVSQYDKAPPVTPTRMLADRMSNEQIGELIRRLYSLDAQMIEEAKTSLLKLARESDQDRDQIVVGLIAVLDNPSAINIEISDNLSWVNSSTWYAAAEILGELRAEEAIDTLVKYIDFNDGVIGSSPNHFPALAALIKIGEPATPKLIEALSNSESVISAWKASTRVKAARALGNIGGEEAKTALEQALLTETDETVILSIKSSLGAIRRGGIN